MAGGNQRTSSRIATKAKVIGILMMVCITLFAAMIYYFVNHTTIGGEDVNFVHNINITELDLSGTGITELSGIEKCKKLESLNLRDLSLSSVEVITECEKLKNVDLRGNDISIEKYDEIQAALPQCKILWDVPIGGEKYPSDTANINLNKIAVDDYKLLKYLTELSTVESSETELCAELLELYEARPNCTFNWLVTLCDKSYDCNTEKIDLNDVRVRDLEAFKQQLAYLPKLRKIELCRSGLSNKQMEELIAAYPDVKFVWEITMGAWTVRTDVTNFSTANIDGIAHPTRTQVAQVKYLTDLVALDLGHTLLPSLEFLSELTSLRSLILVDCDITDITPLESLVNLEYVELFENRIEDISVVSKWTKLKEINLATNFIKDFSPLYECKMLERVWLGKNRKITKKERSEILANLPEGVELNTYIYIYCGSTERNYNNPDERGWRPIDYRTWGFTYENPNNSTFERTTTENHSNANVDSTPKDD